MAGGVGVGVGMGVGMGMEGAYIPSAVPTSGEHWNDGTSDEDEIAVGDVIDDDVLRMIGKGEVGVLA